MKDEETIFQFLKKVKRKLRINKSIKSLLIFASIGAVLSALIMGYSKIFPFYYAVPAALIAAGVTLSGFSLKWWIYDEPYERGKQRALKKNNKRKNDLC